MNKEQILNELDQINFSVKQVRRLLLEQDDLPEEPIPLESEQVKAANLNIERGRFAKFYVEEVFTSHNGVMQPDNSSVFGLPRWAYKKHIEGKYFPEAGAAHHIFCIALDKNNEAITDLSFDVYNHLGRDEMVPGLSGWACLPTFDNFNPELTRGVTKAKVSGYASEVVEGMGKYYGWRVSTFIVFRERS